MSQTDRPQLDAAYARTGEGFDRARHLRLRRRLVDSERLALQVNVTWLAELGRPILPAVLAEQVVGRSHEHFVEAVESHLGHPLPPGWEEPFQQRHRLAFAADLRPVGGIVEALNGISTPACVASSGTHEKMRFTLGLVGLYDRFDGRIFSATEVPNGKPAPDLFLHAASTLGTDPAACVVVEDSRYGVQAARAAGMRVLAYAGGLTPADQLAGPCTAVFDNMRELPQLLDALAN